MRSQGSAGAPNCPSPRTPSFQSATRQSGRSPSPSNCCRIASPDSARRSTHPRLARTPCRHSP
eukprot:2117496-Prymnesium_polylepis.1